MMPNRVTTLPEDILFSVLRWCDVASVISTCRTLREASRETHVWRALIRELQSNWVLESSIPNLGELSLDQLINLVKRAVQGPDSWNRTDASEWLTPVVSKTFQIGANIPSGPGILTWENDARLVPNGKFVLFMKWGTLESYDVAKNKLVWTYISPVQALLPPQHYCAVRDFAFGKHPDKGGDWLVVMIGERTYPPHASGLSRQNYMTILELDPSSGNHAPLLVTRTPSTSFDNPFSRLSVDGDFAIADCGPGNLLVDWRAGRYLWFKQSEVYRWRITVVLRRALIVAVGQHATELWVVPIIDTFEKCGRPITELEHDEGTSTLPSALRRSAARTVAHTFTPSGSSKNDVEISLHQSPLSPDIWRLWVYTVGDNQKSASDLGSNESKLTHVLCRCKIDGSTGEIKNVSSAPSESLYVRAPNGLSYSGHAQIFDAYGRRWQLIVPPPSPERYIFGIRHRNKNGDPLKLTRTGSRGKLERRSV
ncbi:hypothetical protein HMN09_00252000 [Mycena chlorophos]|uniref:F-box domain-containing protein n=1 Tax=Mycena chlorophos TaxID=658473 RepID=A0A8H6WJE8_MYCCL|nr:hypothetical protein HMN09_00252000 [Mycena chlorophos]